MRYDVGFGVAWLGVWRLRDGRLLVGLGGGQRDWSNWVVGWRDEASTDVSVMPL